MRATGIVRRTDDLGRVVIPKEIRRALGIKEGEPLEVFTEHNRVIFQKYQQDVNWIKIFDMIKALINKDFALYDDEGTCRKRTSAFLPVELSDLMDEAHCILIDNEAGDILCTVAVDPEVSLEDRKRIVGAVKIIMQED